MENPYLYSKVEDNANRVTKREDIKCTSMHNARQKVKASKGVDNMVAKDSCVGSKRKKQRKTMCDEDDQWIHLHFLMACIN
nr:hypothetical protein [Tanacetum cinerariifolium]